MFLSHRNAQTYAARSTASCSLHGRQHEMQAQIDQLDVGHRDGHFPGHHGALVKYAIERLAKRDTLQIVEAGKLEFRRACIRIMLGHELTNSGLVVWYRLRANSSSRSSPTGCPCR